MKISSSNIHSPTPEMQLRISRARTSLLLNHPFYGVLAMRLVIQQGPVPTAATDGRYILYNPTWFESLTDAEIIGVIAHEIMHLACGHMWRKQSRDLYRWNIACDIAINNVLEDSGFTLPGKALVNKEYYNMAAEAIYNKIKDSIEGTGNLPGGAGDFMKPGEVNQVPGGKDGISESESNITASNQSLEKEWQIATAQAAQVTRNKGDLPGNIKQMIDEFINPSIPWPALLRDFVMRCARNDYNWSRPNRRYLSSGFVLPGLISDELPEVIMAIDTSGSISNEELKAFADEVSGILMAFDTTTTVIWIDSRVCGVEKYTRADLPLKLTAKGRGGTDFRPAVNQNDTCNKAPFGDVVKMTI